MERRQRGRLKHQEDVLAAHVVELKADLSACRDARAAAKLASSLGVVKSAEEYGRDRHRSLQALLQVPRGCGLRVQCDVMSEECDMCSKPAYTLHNLTAILHQFYCDRVSQLVQLRHMLMVRWARFAGTDSKVSEELYHHFHQRMQYLLFEYNDSLHRARRLAGSHDSHMTNKAAPSVTINSDDVMIYLRWLVTHQHNTKTATAFVSNIGWLPSLHRNTFSQALHSSPPPPPPAKPVQTSMTKPKPVSATTAKWLSAAKELHTSTVYTGSESTSHSLTTNHTHRAFLCDEISRDHMTSHVTTSDITRDHVTVASSLGGGGASKLVGVVSATLPLHTTDVHKLRDQLQELMIRYGIRGSSSVHPPSDQLQLYYMSSQKFQSVFSQQESLSSYIPYDSASEGGGNTSAAFIKPANWKEFVQIMPEPEPVQITAYTKIRDRAVDVDPLLSLSSLTSHLHTLHRAIFALRQHAVTVRQPSLLPPLTTTTRHPSQSDMALVWKSLYMGLDSRNPMSTEDMDSMETDAMDNNDATNEGAGDASNKDPVMEIGEASQVMHNEKGCGISAKAAFVAKDSYFSYLLLRHLKTRDMRMSCLSILNYFRSVERTLTINHQGLSMESGQQQPTRNGGLLNHRHLHNTPADYVISEAKFMQFTEVENHDDFYEFLPTPEGSRGAVNIWDPQGVGVVYDAALEDLQRLEGELLTVGTYNIERGEGLGEVAGTEDTAAYSRREVDRFAVLHDLWTSEASYQNHKMKLVNSYLECYHHISDRTGKKEMAKVITTLMWSRPRYDPDSAYFTTTFYLECQCLQAHQRLVRSMVDCTMEAERSHSERLWEGRSQQASHRVYGLGLPPSPSHSVSLTGHKPLLPPSSLLEACSSLSSLSALPLSLDTALTELSHHHKVTSSPTHTLTLLHKLLEVCLEEWEEQRMLGTGFSPDTVHNVFWDRCVEDAHTMCAVCEECAGGREKEGKGGGGEAASDKQTARLQAWCNILQLTTLRHHLLLTSSESNLLTRHYKQLLASLGHEECHANLRCVTFDPTVKYPTDKSLDYFISKVKDSSPSTSLDRFTPAHPGLAVTELDDKHITTSNSLSFRSHDHIKEILTSHNGLHILQTALRAQVTHKWSLAIACLLNTALLEALEEAGHIKTVAAAMKMETASSSVASTAPRTSFGVVTTASETGQNLFLKKTLQKAFVSVQSEKVPVRDHMLAVLSSRVQSMGRSQNDMETAKCAAIGQFCVNLVGVMSQHSLRAQIMQLSRSLLSLLEHFPATRDAYFTIGRISTNGNSPMPIVKDSRSHLAHPSSLLTGDGCKILNLWYIPHTAEVLTMFSGEPLERRQQSLRTVLGLLSPLLTLLLYHTAYVRLGRSSSAGLGGGRGSSGGASGVGGDWGGTEGIGAVVHQLQTEIASLPDPSDPQQVEEYLCTSCELLYLEHTLAVEHYLQRTILLHGNHEDMRTLRMVSIPTIRRLSTAHSTPHPAYSALTTPTLPPDQSDRIPTLFPWQRFLRRCGPTPSLLDHYVWVVGEAVLASVAALPLEERVTANGEMLGLSLLLEEVTQAHAPSDSTTPLHLILPPSHPPSSLGNHSRKTFAHSASSRTSQTSLTASHRSSRSAITRQHPSLSSSSPMKTVRILRKFLELSLQLEILRQEWSLQALGGAHSLSTQRQCQQVEQAFRDRVMGVAKKAVAKQMSHDLAKMTIEGDVLDESASQSTTFLTEGGMSGGGANGDTLSADQLDNLDEMMLREAQVSRLLELLELGMIRDTLRHVSRFHHLMTMEQNRDDSTLPLDLWKTSPSMKEPTGVPRPHIVANFLSQFHSSSTDSGPAYTISKSAFRDCVHQLTSGVMNREKESFQIYAGHYEGLVRSLYSQLYQRDRQIERWRREAVGRSQDSSTEALVTAGEFSQTLLLELTALRVRIKELENQLQTQEGRLRKSIQQEYSSLTGSLLSTCTAIKTRYEDYRSQLYSDVLRSVQEVRQATAEGVAKTKENLTGHTPLDVAVTTKLQGEDVCNVQNENAQLNKLLVKQQTLSHLRQGVCEDVREREVNVWRGECEGVRRRGLEERMLMEVERNSLRARVSALEKRLGEVRRERESARKELDEERRAASKKPAASKTQSQLTQRAPKALSANMKQLVNELDDKEKQIKTLETSQEKQHCEEERGQRRFTQKLQAAQQQLDHERHLKREAFHQVDDLLTQVHDLEDQQHLSLRVLQSGRRTVTSSTPHSFTSSTPHSITSSTPHSFTSRHRHSSTPHTRRHSVAGSTSYSRPESRQQTRPKSQQQQQHPSSSRGVSSHNSEVIDLSQEILALKLI